MCVAVPAPDITPPLVTPPADLNVPTATDPEIAVFLAGAMGLGVLFSGFTVLIVQGSLTALFYVVGSQISPATVTELSAIGGLMIMAIGFNLETFGSENCNQGT